MYSTVFLIEIIRLLGRVLLGGRGAEELGESFSSEDDTSLSPAFIV